MNPRCKECNSEIRCSNCNVEQEYHSYKYKTRVPGLNWEVFGTKENIAKLEKYIFDLQKS